MTFEVTNASMKKYRNRETALGRQFYSRKTSILNLMQFQITNICSIRIEILFSC